MNNEISMLEITHYTDNHILDQIQSFHAKTLFTSIPEARSRTFVSGIPINQLERFENKESRINTGFSDDYKIITKPQKTSERKASHINFSDSNSLSFSEIENLLLCSFSSNNEIDKRRPYPSGGRQYPIEVFLCRLSNNIPGWSYEENVLHFLPMTKSFEKCALQTMNELNRSLAGSDKDRLG